MTSRRKWALAGLVAAMLMAYMYSRVQRFSEITVRLDRLRMALQAIYNLEDALGEMPDVRTGVLESLNSSTNDEETRKLFNEFSLALRKNYTGTIVPVLDSSGDWLCGEEENRNRKAALFASLKGDRIDPGDAVLVGDSVKILNRKTDERYSLSLDLDDVVIISWDGQIRTLTGAEKPEDIRRILLDINCCE